MTINMSVWGPDISSYQTIDWKAFSAHSGASFVIMKASEGMDADSHFSDNWKHSHAECSGMVKGAYHYGHTENDPIAEAKHYMQIVHQAGGFKPGDFAALDIEDVCPASHKVNPAASAEWCSKWVNQLILESGLPASRIVVYTGMWWWEPRAGGSTLLANQPLWLSAYSTTPPAIKGWKKWTLWQYTDQKDVNGISGHVDASVFSGNQAQLHAWANTVKK